MPADNKNSMDMSSLSSALDEITVAKLRRKGKVSINIPYEQELEAKANGTYVNPYSAADNKKMHKFLDGQGYEGPRY